MEYRSFGRTGVQVSALCLGTMNFGGRTSQADAAAIITRALDAGINFIDYVVRVRTEKAKHLLLNPNLRISEIAYEVGFQSLTHFNRVFKKLIGESPTVYRGHLPKAV